MLRVKLRFCLNSGVPQKWCGHCDCAVIMTALRADNSLETHQLFVTITVISVTLCQLKQPHQYGAMVMVKPYTLTVRTRNC